MQPRPGNIPPTARSLPLPPPSLPFAPEPPVSAAARPRPTMQLPSAPVPMQTLPHARPMHPLRAPALPPALPPTRATRSLHTMHALQAAQAAQAAQAFLASAAAAPTNEVLVRKRARPDRTCEPARVVNAAMPKRVRAPAGSKPVPVQWWHRRRPPQPAAKPVGAAGPCTYCNGVRAAEGICGQCFRAVCGPCGRVCDGCNAELCTACAVANYDEMRERDFCRACDPGSQ